MSFEANFQLSEMYATQEAILIVMPNSTVHIYVPTELEMQAPVAYT
jgi:hypothetical protein